MRLWSFLDAEVAEVRVGPRPLPLLGVWQRASDLPLLGVWQRASDDRAVLDGVRFRERATFWWQSRPFIEAPYAHAQFWVLAHPRAREMADVVAQIARIQRWHEGVYLHTCIQEFKRSFEALR